MEKKYRRGVHCKSREFFLGYLTAVYQAQGRDCRGLNKGGKQFLYELYLKNKPLPFYTPRKVKPMLACNCGTISGFHNPSCPCFKPIKGVI